MTLAGKTALVTGGGTGIGAGIALGLAQAGCKVAISGRREDKLMEAAALFSGEPKIVYHVADVADRTSVEQLFAWGGKELGPISILVNCAGANIQKRSMADLSPEDWDKLMNINATGAYNCCRAALPGMRARKDGVIINISSVAGKRAGLLGGIAYNASKFAMSALGLTLGVEEREHNIRVTNIYPGEVETPILDLRPVPVSAEARAKILQPADIAAAVVMVASLHPRAHVPELVMKPTSQVYV